MFIPLSIPGIPKLQYSISIRLIESKDNNWIIWVGELNNSAVTYEELVCIKNWVEMGDKQRWGISRDGG